MRDIRSYMNLDVSIYVILGMDWVLLPTFIYKYFEKFPDPPVSYSNPLWLSIFWRSQVATYLQWKHICHSCFLKGALKLYFTDYLCVFIFFV